MKTTLPTNERYYNSPSTWDNASVYGYHGYHNQQQYPNQQISYEDSGQYGVSSGRRYVMVPSATYTTPSADTPGLRPCLEDTAQCLPTSADQACQPDNVSVTGSYASTGTGSAYSGGCVDGRRLQQRLPDVVGAHLEGWMNRGVCALQDSSRQQQGILQLADSRSNVYKPELDIDRVHPQVRSG